MMTLRAGVFRLLASVMALAIASGSLAAQEEPPGSPAEQVSALEKAFNDAMEGFQKKYQEATTDEARTALFESDYPKPDGYAPKFLAIAKAHPDDAAALDALKWVVERSQGNGETGVAAIEQLIRDHAADPRIASMVGSLEYGPPASRGLAEAILEKNPDREAQGQACLVLAKKWVQDADYSRRLKKDDEMRQRLEQFYGKAEVERLATLDPAAAEAKAEALFERVTREFADLKSFRGTLGEAASAQLFEMRNLAIGKVAPEVMGEDIDGEAFKLSDYRGKVVLIDFWGDW